jgi:hypothetical protein
MENLENPTTSSASAAAASQVRRKNNFSIENILARPDTDFRDNREVKVVKFMRQNPFQNNHVLFANQNHSMINNHHEMRKLIGNDVKMENESHLESGESEIADDRESLEIASDDGNSNCGSCKKSIIFHLGKI